VRKKAGLVGVDVSNIHAQKKLGLSHKKP